MGYLYGQYGTDQLLRVAPVFDSVVVLKVTFWVSHYYHCRV
jgi:hypothetical protein